MTVTASLRSTPIREELHTSQELEERFEKIRFLGKGDQGCVFEVIDRVDGIRKALKIAFFDEVCGENRRIQRLITKIQLLSPHLTRLHEMFGVKGNLFSLPFLKLSHDVIRKSKTIDETEKPLNRRAYLMELMEGNLENCTYTKVEALARDIQMASIDIMLKKHNIDPFDSRKFANILFKKLDASDVFNGKSMAEYDFWKYTFGQYSFYLPKPRHLIKLCDYDAWQTKKILNIDSVSILKSHVDWSKKSLADLEATFKKPDDPNATILDMCSL